MIIDSLISLAVPITTLEFLPSNPRVGDIDAVSRSLARFGQRKPIVVLTETRVVIAGNHTLQAAIALGWEEIAAVFVDESLEEGKAFALADNRVHDLGRYLDEELLAMLQAVSDIESLGLDGTGYLQKDIDALLENTDISDYPIIEDSTREIDTGEWEFEHTCPKCRFEFND